MRLLVIAPECNPDDVGETWVAYQWVHRLAARHDLTLLTYYQRRFPPPSTNLPGARVVEWRDMPVPARAERLNSLLQPGYALFYVRARRWLRAALARGENFDIAFQPIPVAMRYPCPAAGLGIPYVLGPVGGSLAAPPGFPSSEDTAPWYVRLRALDRWRIEHDPLMRRTYEQADCVLGIAPYVAEFLSGVPLRRFEVMSETGIDDVPDRVDRSGRTGPVRLLFVGRLIRTKGARDAIRAMGRLRTGPVVLDIVGDGFDRGACEALVAELDLGDRVRFHGWQPRAVVDAFYRDADVFVFPSYREPGGNVTFEAMRYGLPLIVCDRGGPGNVVDDSCGIRLPARTPEQFAGAIAAAVDRLVADRDLRVRMGEQARARVVDIAQWDGKVERMEALWRDLLDRQPPVRG